MVVGVHARSCIVLGQLAVAASTPLGRRQAPRRRRDVLPVQLQQVLALGDQETYVLGRLLKDCRLRHTSTISTSTLAVSGRFIYGIIYNRKASNALAVYASKKGKCSPYSISWWRGTVVERRSLTGELSLSCARPAADG